MNVTAVRKMTKGERRYTFNIPPQRVTVRCPDCSWHRVNVLVEEGSEAYQAHRRSKHD